MAKCFFKNIKENDIENLLQTLRQPSENYRNLNLNNDIGFLILNDATQWQSHLLRTKEDGREVIIPIDKNVFDQSEEIPGGILRQELDKWLSGRDLFEDRFPVSGLKFYGRDAELQNLMRNIDEGQHTGIYGLRKVGKTSLMQKLAEKRPLDLVVYVDLQEISVNDCAYLYWKIARKLQDELTHKKELGLALKEIKLDLGSESDYLALDKPEEKNALRFDGDVRRLLGALATNETTASSKIVITIDELEYMLPIGADNGFRGYDLFFRYLRGISQSTHGRVVSVIAAANPAISEEPRWEGRDNPVFQFYREVFLPPLEKQECNEMITKIGRGMSVSFDVESLEAIYSETGGHPYITRQLCSHLVAQDKSRPLQVNRRLISDNINSFVRDKRAIFEEIIERLKNYFPEELDLLLAIAAKGSAKGSELAPLVTVPIDVALRHLIGYQIVDFQQGEYKIKINLLHSWLKTYRLGK
ncbi:ATP-binding protein [Limnofasciculus baicalensis]|uniref:ATP-binding protein n=1 Tax=Limnofasciculus baicalensis BBK-W-15 TaxID=2699891 RepID=A0AAE3GQI9_9CYAN|nr:ATP-binding protein [Limnofasciculus baicalensis]MCP2728870.1 ATP-binding protein [Limnofasciculus baicalensis BBK-W-15]